MLSQEARSRRTTYIVILAVGIALILPSMINRSFWFELKEARRALMALEMASKGDWIVPHFLGRVRLTKPPLFFWLAALALRATGSTAEWAPRIPSFVLSLVALCAFARLLELLLGPRESRWGALALLVTPIYHWMSHGMELEMVFVSTGLVALMGFWEVIRQTRWAVSWRSMAWFFLGLSFMVKGPVVPLIVLGSLALWALVARPPHLIKTLGVFRGIAIFLLPCLIWEAMLLSRGIFPQVFLAEVGHHVGQEAPHSEGVWYYIEQLHKYTFPWAFLLYGAVIGVIWRASRRGIEDFRSSAAAFVTEDSGRRAFLVVWFFVSMLVLSVIPSKRYYYALALAPPVSALAAMILSRWLDVANSADSPDLAGTRLLRWILGIAGVLCGIGAVAVEPPELWHPFYGKHTPENPLILWVAGAGLTGMALMPASAKRLFMSRFRSYPAPWWAISCLSGAILFYGFSIYPKTNEPHSLKRAAREMREILPEGASVYLVSSSYAVFYYWGIVDPKIISTPQTLREYAAIRPDAFGIVNQKDEDIIREAGPYDVLYRAEYLADKDSAPLLFRLRIETGRVRRRIFTRPRAPRNYASRKTRPKPT